ncbi:hypothetical protein BGX27_002052, partial [Mortierella sp. AM989]
MAKEIAEKFGVSVFAVYKLIKTYKERGTLESIPIPGHPKALSDRNIRFRKRITK